MPDGDFLDDVKAVGEWAKGMLCDKFEIACDVELKMPKTETAYDVSQSISEENSPLDKAADALEGRQSQLQQQMRDLGI